MLKVYVGLSLVSIALALSSLNVRADVQRVDNYISISGMDCNDAESKGAVTLNCDTYHQTTNYTCGPAAVMTLMHFYGRLDQTQMNATTELHIAMEMGASAEGTTQAQMANWLSNHGFKVETGIRVQSDMIIKNLKNHILTLVAYNHHWILAKGYVNGVVPDEDQILFSDSCCSTTEISPKVLDSLWQEAEMAKDHTSSCVQESQYIVAVPK